MAQWLETLVVLPDDPGSIPIAYTVAHNHVTPVPEDPMTSSGLCKHCLHTVHKYTCRKNTQIHKVKINKSLTDKISNSERNLLTCWHTLVSPALGKWKRNNQATLAT